MPVLEDVMCSHRDILSRRAVLSQVCALIAAPGHVEYPHGIASACARSPRLGPVVSLEWPGGTANGVGRRAG
eukprot:7534100-Alexandrium_andersonii.AAC.1